MLPRIYESSTGHLYEGDTLKATGYSGFGPGKNNPLLCNVPDVGPIPAGAYLMGDVVDSPEHGPITIHLVPIAAELYGRSAFRIHGDSRTHPGEASKGCIILGHDVRAELAESRNRLLLVTQKLPKAA